MPKKQTSASDGTDSEENQQLRAYRELLLTAEEQSQSEYDRLIVALSGGALGVSFAFVHQFIGDKPPVGKWALMLAWTSWVSSLAVMLASHYFSVKAMRKAIGQTDQKRINEERAGGMFDVAVEWLNAVSGLFFVIGAVMAITFVFFNLR